MPETCHVCEKEFDDLRGWAAHLKNIHAISKEEMATLRAARIAKKREGEARHFCTLCPKSFSQKSSLTRHSKEHDEQEKEESPLICESCLEQFTTDDSLIEHKIRDHRDFLDEIKKIEFSTKDSFEVWFLKLQQYTSSSFFIRNSFGKTIKTKLYCCHRQGSYQFSASERVPTTSKKTVESCPTFVKMKEYPNGKVDVEFRVKHNHAIDHASLKFTGEDIKYLQMNLRTKKDCDILEEIKKDFTTEHRLFYANMDDLRNVRIKYGIFPGRNHENDLESLKIASQNSEDIRKLVMPTDNDGTGFQMTIISSVQLEWLKNFSRRGVIIDDTFHISKYDVRLTTLLTLDERDQFRPSCFFFSRSLNTDDVSDMFKTVLSVYPEFSPKFFISDEAAQLWNGFRRTFPNISTVRLLCQFHVLKNWKNHCNSIKNVNSRLNIIGLLKCAMKTKDRATSERALLRMYTLIDNDDSLSKFGEYFRSHCEPKKDLWAASYRHFCPFNTSGAAEAWHSLLKGKYLGRRQNIRLDSILHVLLSAIRDISLRRTVEVSRGLSVRNSRLSKTNQNHMKAMKLFENDEVVIQKIENNRYSMRVGTTTTNIMINEIGCTCEEVNAHCKICNVCPYETFCSCKDCLPGICCPHQHEFHQQTSCAQLEDNCFEDDTICDDKISDSENLWELEGRDMNCGVDENKKEGQNLELEAEKKEEDELAHQRGNSITSYLSIQTSLDFLARKSEEMKGKNDSESLQTLEKHLKQLTLTYTGSISMESLSLDVRPEVRKNPKLIDPTMREKLGLKGRKRRRVINNEYLKINVGLDDIEICCICKLAEPEDDDSETIDWVACQKCKIWAHRKCSDGIDKKCEICNGDFVENEHFNM